MEGIPGLERSGVGASPRKGSSAIVDPPPRVARRARQGMSVAGSSSLVKTDNV